MPFLASEGCFWPPSASMTSEVKINYAYVTMQDICNKFIEVNLCVGCMIWRPNRMFQDRTFVKYWWDKKELVCMQFEVLATIIIYWQFRPSTIHINQISTKYLLFKVKKKKSIDICQYFFRMSSIQVTDIIYIAILFTQYSMTTPYSRPNLNDHFKADFSGKLEFEETIVLHFLSN